MNLPVQLSTRTHANRSHGDLRHAIFALVLLAIVALSGCESTPYPNSAGTQGTPRIRDNNASELLLRAQSNSGSVDASALWLAAAQALFAESRQAEAADALANVDLRELTDIESFDHGALTVELALSRYDGPTARAFFAQLQPLSFAQDEKFTQLAERIKALNVDPAAAANALIAAPIPRSKTLQQQRSDQIWALISQSSADVVEQQFNNTSGIEVGWWQLKEQMLGAFTIFDAAGRLTRWQANHPLHPASQTPPAELQGLKAAPPKFDHIALLVPQTGPLAAAGKAVRDGFLAAHLYAEPLTASTTREGTRARSNSANPQDTATRPRPRPRPRPRQITILDSAGSELPDLVRQARSSGADLIVGPLDKNRVAQLNQLPESLPTLLLNYLPEDIAVRGDIVQFGLAVEDEAKAIARRIQAEGLERIVVLHNEKDWSLRARDALMKEFENAALTPVAAIDQRRYSRVVGIGSTPDVKQVTSVVGNALLVDASSSRHKQLERFLGEDIEFVARARQDVDAIVAFLDSPEARALRPALKFHFSSRVPVYTSSQALRRITARDLRDLRGFYVSEIPWKLYPSPIKQTVEDSFGVTKGGLVPLYALGVDAYRLADRLDLLLNNAESTPARRHRRAVYRIRRPGSARSGLGICWPRWVNRLTENTSRAKVRDRNRRV